MFVLGEEGGGGDRDRVGNYKKLGKEQRKKNFSSSEHVLETSRIDLQLLKVRKRGRQDEECRDRTRRAQRDATVWSQARSKELRHKRWQTIERHGCVVYLKRRKRSYGKGRREKVGRTRRKGVRKGKKGRSGEYLKRAFKLQKGKGSRRNQRGGGDGKTGVKTPLTDSEEAPKRREGVLGRSFWDTKRTEPQQHLRGK